MSEFKFNEGQEVKFKPQAAAGIPMKRVEVIGVQDISENPWEKRYCSISGCMKPRRLSIGEGFVEPRYVIGHFNGWVPSNQKDLNKDLEVLPNVRYQFAYESELRSCEE